MPQEGRRPHAANSNAIDHSGVPHKFAAGRVDRKLDFAVPQCDSTGGPLVFTIEEPKVTMVALGSNQGQRALQGSLAVHIKGSARSAMGNGPSVPLVSCGGSR